MNSDVADRAITDFIFSIFLFSIIVVISSFIECMPVESAFPPPFPQILCVCGGGGGRGGCASACQCMWLSECVCVFPIYFLFFLLAFVLVNDLSLVSRCFLFWKCVRFCVFVFVAVCFFLLYAFVFYVYCRVLPDALSLMFFQWSHSRSCELREFLYTAVTDCFLLLGLKTERL